METVHRPWPLNAGARWLQREGTLWVLFGLQLILAAAWLLHEGRGLTFFADDWKFVLGRLDNNVDAFLAPQAGQHLVVAAVVVYKAMLYTVGMNYAAFRVLAVGFHLLCATLLYLYARRRLGGLLALVPPALLLFFGPAYEDLLWTFQIGYLGSLACGLAMLLALERRDHIGDVGACLLLVLAIGFSPVGVAFLLGAAVDVLARPGRWGRTWVFLVPLALYAAWYSHWGHRILVGSNIVHVLPYVAAGNAYSVGSLAGLGGTRGAGGVPGLGAVPPSGEAGLGLGSEWGVPLALVLGFFLLRLLLTGRVSVRLWALVAVALGFWVPLAFARATLLGAEPSSSRYIYPGSFFLLLIAIEALRGVRLRHSVLLVVVAATAVAVLSNLGEIYPGRTFLLDNAEGARAEIGAVELAKTVVPYEFGPDGDRPAAAGYFLGPGYFHAGDYIRAVKRFGSPAATPEEIRAAPEPVREAVDSVLSRALGVKLVPVRFEAGRRAPEVGAATSVRVRTAGSCLAIDPLSVPGSVPALDIRVPAAGIGVRTTKPGTMGVALRQFADAFTTTLPSATARSVVLRIRGETPPLTWYAHLQPTGPATVCALAA